MSTLCPFAPQTCMGFGACICSMLGIFWLDYLLIMICSLRCRSQSTVDMTWLFYRQGDTTLGRRRREGTSCPARSCHGHAWYLTHTSTTHSGPLHLTLDLSRRAGSADNWCPPLRGRGRRVSTPADRETPMEEGTFMLCPNPLRTCMKLGTYTVGMPETSSVNQQLVAVCMLC